MEFKLATTWHLPIIGLGREDVWGVEVFTKSCRADGTGRGQTQDKYVEDKGRGQT